MKKFLVLTLVAVAGAVAYVWLTENSGRDIWDDVLDDL